MATIAKNWRKQVTINPPSGIKFTIDTVENKPLTHITITNTSEL